MHDVVPYFPYGMQMFDECLAIYVDGQLLPVVLVLQKAAVSSECKVFWPLDLPR